MKPAPFDYHAAESLDHALALKAQHGDAARFLAGGQSLMATMNFRLAQPGALIDINPIEGLDEIRVAPDGSLVIGALARHRRVERDGLVARHAPLLQEAVREVAHPQIRTRGTICGNLAHADPASEMPAVMVALGASMRAQSVAGSRWIAAEDFFVGVLTTALRADEMLTAIALPAPASRTGTCFLEVARRRGDYPMMGAAVAITLDADGTCNEARIAFCSAGPTPMGAPQAAASLVGGRVTPEDIRAAAALVGQEIDPLGGLHASRDFQLHLANVLTGRALATALRRATELPS